MSGKTNADSRRRKGNAEQLSFSAQWTGRFAMPESTDADLRLAHLQTKHLK